MKLAFGLCILAFALVSSGSCASTYTAKFDTVNVDEVLTNDRILANYTKCLLDKGPCTPEARELKKLLPDALGSDCSKCTAIQRKNSEKVIRFLRANKKDDWKVLSAKYDPKGLYRARHHLDY